MIILQIDRNFNSEIFFILPNSFSDHLDVTFKSFSKGACVGFSSALSPLQALELFQFSFFTILFIDYQLISVCSTIFLGAKCVWGCSSCEQINSSTKSLFSSIETVLGYPEPCLLSIEPVSLKFFNTCLTEE